VESNCVGCPYFKTVIVGEPIIQEGELISEMESGCFYPSDTKTINGNIREPYLTIQEIASNTCDFWKSRTAWQPDKLDASFDKVDLNYTPSDLHSIVPDENNEPGLHVPLLELADDCGVRY
jgi:hypothetical protein